MNDFANESDIDFPAAYFDKYVSNTLIGSGNHRFFDSESEKTAVAFYKVFKSGKFGYSFLFENAVDSTYGDGNRCLANTRGERWLLSGAEVFVTDNADPSAPARQRQTLCFDGKTDKCVAAGECFCSDETVLDVKENEYLGFKITFCGKSIPCLESNLIPSFAEKNGEFLPDKFLPLPAMIGVARNVKKRLLFWGDSITQGCGTSENTYSHYAAVAAKLCGTDYSVWDIGVGWARAYDAATCGYWMKKALLSKPDIAVICFGVNDIGSDRTPERIIEDLSTIAEKTKASGATVILQTIPPFSFCGESRKVWRTVNEFIIGRKIKSADFIFDNRAILGKGEDFSEAKYGLHPNADGCLIWGRNLYAQSVSKNL